MQDLSSRIKSHGHSFSSDVNSYRTQVHSYYFYLQPVDFGGCFKEAITVSTWSARSFQKALQILDQCTGEKGNVANRSIFRNACGIHSEADLYASLVNFAEGRTDKSGFNRAMKDLKVCYNRNNDLTLIYKVCCLTVLISKVWYY